MEHVELVTVSSETDSNQEEEEVDHTQEDFKPLIRGGDSTKTKAQIRRTRLVYDSSGAELKSSSKRCSWKKICICILFISIVCVSVFIFWTGEEEKPVRISIAPSLDYMDFKQPKNMISYKDIMEDNFRFNLSSSSDVMVFLHIQKTGGTTFGRHLVQDINLENPCLCHRKRTKAMRRKLHCDCFRPGTRDQKNWLFSRYSTGWKCGLHPDWTELTGCVDNYLVDLEGQTDRRYFYITYLRNPVDRYLSEWRHVQRGATWRTAELKCGNRSWADDITKCYEDVRDDFGEYSDWSGVELNEFMSCPSNLASNRQTRMLADLELVHCYDEKAMTKEKRNLIMLNSAKSNLERMAYFGITEEQRISQYLFEETFNLEFKISFQQYNSSVTHSGSSKDNLDDQTIKKIKSLNQLDEELYKFAHQLLKTRFEALKSTDDSYQDHIQRLDKEKYEFSWDDIENENYDTPA